MRGEISTVAAPRRAHCQRCLRPQATCICHWIAPTPHQVEVAILQHPLEVHQAKNSARLLHLCLPQSRLFIGEAFGADELQAILHQPFIPGDQGGSPVQSVLLYPEEGTGGTVSQAAPFLAPPGARLRLIVLDGTWRKSRKMLHANPGLAALPRFALRKVPASRYLIRKAHAQHQLSTFEAVCQALGELEGEGRRFEALLEAFDGFVAQQAGYVETHRG